MAVKLGSVCATQVISPEQHVSPQPFGQRLKQPGSEAMNQKEVRYVGLDVHKH